MSWPSCQLIPKPSAHQSCNLRGHRTNQLGQMSITHIASCNKCKYIQITIDAFSHMIHVTCYSGEDIQYIYATFQTLWYILDFKLHFVLYYVSVSYMRETLQCFLTHVSLTFFTYEYGL